VAETGYVILVLTSPSWTDLRKGGRGRGGFGRGGGGPHRGQRERTNKADIDRHNEKYEKYYNELELVPKEKREEFWEAFQRDLPNSFRFTGSKSWVKSCSRSVLH
jgi:hypothetical protein